MKYANLGRSGLKVSRLCLGSYNFGSKTDEKEAFAIMDAALDAGINFFDTANHYPDFVNCGRTEEIIGRWFAQGNNRRDRVVLASKVYQPMMDPTDGPNDEGGLSKYKIRRHIEGSLTRLQTDHIDLYQMHHIDHHAPWEEIWETFEILSNQGKISYVGSSNFPGWCLAMAQAKANERHLLGLVSEQHKYSLLCRLPELEVLPAARSYGIGVLAYSPLFGGQLACKQIGGLPPTKGPIVDNLVDENNNALTSFSALCRELGETPADVALAWILANPIVSCAVIGPSTKSQVEKSLPAPHIVLGEHTMKRLDAIFPGPGGQAPEAYAW
jgi:aryl-alcohol dehydrogenase-like predicted oxidoreductase